MCFLQKPYILRLKSHSFKFLLLQGSNSSLQLFDAVGVLPLHAQVLAAHVAISSQLAVDGLAQVEFADDGGGGQVKHRPHGTGISARTHRLLEGQRPVHPAG